MKWRSDSEVQAIVQNFSRRCGARTEGDDWNVFWGHPWNVQRLFHPDLGTRLRDDQLVNHFPNHLELTRKDQMVKNVKRWLRERQCGPRGVQGLAVAAAPVVVGTDARRRARPRTTAS